MISVYCRTILRLGHVSEIIMVAQMLEGEDTSELLSPGPKTATSKRGKLKIYLGYAAGVGKTYQMLEEAQVLKAKGVDVVIGYFEPHGRKDTIAKTEGLEMVPRKKVEYRGSFFEEMDAEAIIARHPQDI